MWLAVHLCKHIALLKECIILVQIYKHRTPPEWKISNQAPRTKHKAQRPKYKDQRPSSFYTNNLLDLSDNFNQVFLVFHYRLN